MVEVIFRQQRDGGLRTLASACLRIDVGGDAAEHHLDLKAGFLKPLQQGRREGAVAALPILCDLIGRRRIGHHHALGLIDAGKAAGRRRQTAKRPLQAIGERIIAAGIKNHDLDAIGAVQRSRDVLQADHLVTHADLVLELRIGRHQVIAALELHGVAGIEEQGGVGVGRPPRKVGERKIHVALGRVDRGFHLEAEGLENCGNVLRVVARVRQRDSRGLIIGIPHYKRDAAFGPSANASANHRERNGGGHSYQRKQLFHDGPLEAARTQRS